MICVTIGVTFKQRYVFTFVSSPIDAVPIAAVAAIAISQLIFGLTFIVVGITMARTIPAVIPDLKSADEYSNTHGGTILWY